MAQTFKTKESLKQTIINFNNWVRNNNIPLSEAIVRHYELANEFVATQRKDLGYFPYSSEEIASLPPGLVDYSMGAYHPVKHANLKEGETVLDVGCGAGIDVFLAANKVGESGKVFGIDVTFSLLRRAKGYVTGQYRSRMLFISASGGALPLVDQSVDAIIGNCVIHLIQDKPEAFAEFFRVLRPHGRAVIADVVAESEAVEDFYDNPTTYLYAGGGKKTVEEYGKITKAAGFSDFQFIEERQPWDVGDEPMPGGYMMLKKLGHN